MDHENSRKIHWRSSKETARSFSDQDRRWAARYLENRVAWNEERPRVWPRRIAYCFPRNWAICDLHTPYGFGTFNSLHAGERADSTFCNIVFVNIFCFFLLAKLLLEIQNFHRDVFAVLQVCNFQNIRELRFVWKHSMFDICTLKSNSGLKTVYSIKSLQYFGHL